MTATFPRVEVDPTVSGAVAIEAAARAAADAAHEADTTNVHGIADTGALATTAAMTAADALLVPLTQKGAANGVGSLDGAGKQTAGQIPTSVPTIPRPGAVAGQAIDASTGLPISVVSGSVLVAAPTGVAATDRAILQTALDIGGHVVAHWPGTYLTDVSLIIGSNTTLELGKNTKIKRADAANCHLIHNRAYVNGSGRDANIEIRGGTWERGVDTGSGPLVSGAAMGLHSMVLHGIDGLTLRNFAAIDPGGKYFIYPADITKLLIEGINAAVWSAIIQTNGPLRRCTIRNIRGTSGDDSVAVLGNDWPTSANTVGGDLEDVLVEDVMTDSGKQIVKVMPGLNRTAKGITVRCVRGTSTSQSLVSAGQDNEQANTGGGTFEDITIRDVDGTPGSNGLACVSLNAGTIHHADIDGVHVRGTGRKAVDITLTTAGRIDIAGVSHKDGTAVGLINVAPDATITELHIKRSHPVLDPTKAAGYLAVVTGSLAYIELDDCSTRDGDGMFFYGGTVDCEAHFSNVRADGSNMLIRHACAHDLQAQINNAGFNQLIQMLTASGSATIRTGPVRKTGASATMFRNSTQAVRVISMHLPINAAIITPTVDDVVLNDNAGYSTGVGLLVYDGATFRPLKTRAADSDVTALTARVALLEAAAFDPRTVTGLAAWYKADAGTGTTTDGVAVAQWDDQSGNAQHLVQATGTKQPLYKTAIQNGKPVLRFDGTDDFLRKAFTLVQPEHIFVVFRATGAYVGNDTVIDGSALNTMRFYRSSATAMALFATSGAGAAASDPGSWHTWSALFSGASSEFRTDGGAAHAVTVGAGNGGGLILGIAGNQTSNPMAMDLAEVLVYSAALSATDRGRVEAYLKYRWATP